MNPIVIVGGGLSGLAAAVRCSSRNHPVLLLEQKPVLGGRAYSFVDAATGDTVDNGQHLLIAGYERTMAFLSLVGSGGLLDIQPHPELLFHHPEKGFQRFSVPSLPTPFNLAAGILSSGLFSIDDRFRLLRAGLAVWRSRVRSWSGLTIAQWLERCGQTPELRRSFWEPLAVSIMNESTVRASASVFLSALRTAFLGSRRAAALAFPRAGLSDLFAEPARRFVEGRGGVVRCRCEVEELRVENGLIAGIRMRGGDPAVAAACILAVPPSNAAALAPFLHLDQPERAAASPIVSVHLWFAADVMPHKFLGVIGRTVQWMFNRRLLAPSAREDGHISAVISAAHDIVKLENDEIVRIVVKDLRSVYGAQIPEPLRSLVIREKKATISLTPDLTGARPGVVTAIPNLYLAGDWTDTGYPATIEGAILSGERAADLAIEQLAPIGR